MMSAVSVPRRQSHTARSASLGMSAHVSAHRTLGTSRAGHPRMLRLLCWLRKVATALSPVGPPSTGQSAGSAELTAAAELNEQRDRRPERRDDALSRCDQPPSLFHQGQPAHHRAARTTGAARRRRLTSRASASWSAHAKRRRRHQWRRPLCVSVECRRG